jgi:tetratricopeptide (TPR) repeat protein
VLSQQSSKRTLNVKPVSAACAMNEGTLFKEPLVNRLQVVTALLAVLFATIASALSPPPVPQNIWIPPRLTVLPGNHAAIELRSLHIATRVEGRSAVSEWSFEFFNPNGRVLEGELQFPLREGQSILGFALDIDGKLRDAVPVEKAKGQQVFEDVIRARIDPALLSQTEGNNFKLRVYPLPAQGARRVVLRIEETLAERNGRRALRVPLAFGERVGRFGLDVNLNGVRETPRTSTEIGGASVSASAHGQRITWSREQFIGRGIAEIDWPARRAPHAVTGAHEGVAYFQIDMPLNGTPTPRGMPKRIDLAWDASGSGATRDHAREFALLDGYFQAMGNGEVTLMALRNAAEVPRTFPIRNGRWHTLREALELLPYDGATHLGAYRPSAGAEEVLLFSDGLHNYGESSWPATAPRTFAISAADKNAPVFLRQIAQKNGGRFVDLTTTTPRDAAALLSRRSARLARIEGAGVHGVVIPSPYGDGSSGMASAVGKMPVQGTPSLTAVVVDAEGREQRIAIDAPPPKDGSQFAPRRWALARIGELEADYAIHRGEILRLGKRFALVTRETSLIVLDRVEDYVRHEIEPPTELMGEYKRLAAQAGARVTADKQAQINRVLQQLAEKWAWWQRDFPKEKRQTVRTEPAKEAAIAGRADAARVAESIQNAPATQEQKRERITVTGSNLAPAAPPPALASAAPAAAPVYAPAAKALNSARDAVAPSAISAPSSTEATIRLQKWQPDAPYARRFKDTQSKDLYRVYLDERANHAQSAAFFLDAAEALFERQERELALRVLSNLAEMDLENRHILRVLGQRLMQAKAFDAAVTVFKKVFVLAPDEPQSLRDLALAHAAMNEPQRAIDLLHDIVIRPWNGRFPEIELIALAELNAIAATARNIDVSFIDPRLMKHMPLDLRAVLTWDADNTDVDLWVTDPNGEKAFYGHRLTQQGGRMSLDFTGGYGPEEFSLKKAMPGKYKIEANYFGDRRQTVTGPTTLQVKLSTRFGFVDQKDEIVTMRLNGNRSTVFVGEFEVK